MRYKYLYMILFLALAVSACETEKSKQQSFSIAEDLSGQALEDFEALVGERIKMYTNSANDFKTISLDPGTILVTQELTRLYQDSGFKRLWSQEKNRNDAIQIIADSYYEGLNPDDYHHNTLKTLFSQKEEAPEEEAIRIAKIDILLSDAILMYAFHMTQGKVNPESIDPHWNYSKKDVPEDIDLLLIARLEEKSLIDSAKKLQPAIPMYAQYKKWLIHYDTLQKKDIQVQQITFPGNSLKLGDSSELVIELKKHLKNFDVSGVSNYDAVFDAELESTLIDFQNHFGLTADGIAGESTFEALNTSIEERLNMIKVNMERCRWINNLPSNEFLLVNIADFHLYIFRNGTIDYTSRVVVGKEHHETPIFTSRIQYVVFNPTWTVPYSIATKETLPRLKRDPNYLGNRNMTLLRNGQEVNPATVDFSQYSVNNFPFTIRQEPGVYNALGRMKFIFPNKYSVYLHDTPSKSYFSKSERTFSHGCVRVQNPHLLAEELLGNKAYDQSKIAEVLKTNKETIVHLEKPLQVMLMYWTCYQDWDNERIYFYKDVYQRDEKILEQLLKKRQV